MTKKFISQIQKRVISLLRSAEVGTKKPLSRLADDACSEVSRLVACWVLSAYPKAKALIAKGKSVMGKRNLCHDTLLVVSDGVISIIDPTIWQIHPKKRSIYVGRTDSVDAALLVLKKAYKGSWKISETVTLADYATAKQMELKKIIRKIVRFEE